MYVPSQQEQISIEYEVSPTTLLPFNSPKFGDNRYSHSKTYSSLKITADPRKGSSIHYYR